MSFAVFVTAAKPSAKALNRAFLLIQDFEFGEYPEDSRWTLITSKQAPSELPPATVLPIPDISDNAFALSSMTEINTFIRENEDFMFKMGVSSGVWLIIDQKGLETSTCLVCEQIYNPGEDEEGGEGEAGMTSEFRACRLPYEHAWSMICNLDIANMNFEEYVDEGAGEQEDGSWKWMSFDASTKDTEEESAEEVKRAAALKELRDGGYAD
ncbi:hypothetical protein C8F04DRAFT_1260146 [Mycena alexandri]|uniref:DUF6924 domain-containing protein n=1 Tax=Mycena alexandri TaxID=1745969 RepID=A0AAD6SU62_9AGAR|nr:hypothetical protein C8F04DRAFT_1260146 [Mycena alexandri]